MQLTLEGLKAALASYVTQAKASNSSYTITRDNVASLIDKIAKIMTLDTSYIDKLSELDGEFLSYGKDIEEWFQDLSLPSNYDSTGANTLAPADPTYRPNFYSKSLGKKTFKTTVRYNNYERACHFEEQFLELVAMITKRLYDSEALWRYGAKREILGILIDTCVAAEGTGSTTFVASTAYSVGTLLNNGTKYGIAVQGIAVADAYASYAAAEADGKIVTYDIVEYLADPVDATTGEAFVEAVKAAVEKAQDVSEGYSLNGNTLGAWEGLTLIVKQGVMPVIETQVQAGAFHLDKVALPTNIKVVPDFGSTTEDVIGMIIDTRAVKLHPSYRAVREQVNSEGDFINYFLHTENTAYFSRNTFIKIFLVTP